MDSDLERGSVSQPSRRETHPAASLAEAEAAFRRAHPRYDDTTVLDELRRSDFTRLDTGGHVYLDYTGAGLYADWQLSEHLELLRANVFGNPHSVNPTSAAMTELLERAREAVLRFFGASPDEYVAIFTPNATGALRLVGEAYPFHPGDRFLLTFDNHNSVNGIREFARARGAETTYVPSEASDLRVDEQLLPRYLTEVGGEHHNLFAYPAQSNFSGVQHPLEWIEQAHAHGWEVLLDAAAYVPTNRLDLSRWQPDFVALSFYKMFGWPSGVGCLLARREALAKLERPWFSGGTIVAAFVQREWYQSAPGAAHFEDGTVNFLNLLFLHPDGHVIHERYVERVARKHNISLRTGCFCNPGAGEVAFTISRETLVGGEFGDAMTIDDYVEAIGLPSGGAVRASLGLASNFADIHRFSAFASEFIDFTNVPDDLPPRSGC